MNTKLAPLAAGAALAIACVGDSPISTQPDGATDSATSDSSFADGGADTSTGPDAADAGCATTAMSFTSEADSQILSSNPTQCWGTEDIMGVRNDLGTMEAIVRFDVSALPMSAVVTGLRLDLPWAKVASTACTAQACGSCAGVDNAGMFDVYYMTSNWDEVNVSWQYAAAGQPWTTGGATTAGSERTAQPIGTFNHAAASDVAANLDAPSLALLPTWRQNGKVSFQFVAQGATKFLIWTKDLKCGGQTAPKLTVTFCK